MEKGVRFIGNGQAPVHKYWEEIMGYLQDGTFDTRFLVTHRVGLEDFPALFAAFDKRIVSPCFSVTPYACMLNKALRNTGWRQQGVCTDFYQVREHPEELHKDVTDEIASRPRVGSRN